jgi:SAM-dependent methyltransferase
VAAGDWKVTVLDVSATALQLARARLGEQAALVQWIHADITDVQLCGPYEIWHDRAVFHFLTSAQQRAAYLDTLNDALRPGGFVIIGTFAPHGPAECSNLPVCRYDADSLGEILGDRYSLVQKRETIHTTPTGKVQPFTFAVFQRLALSP